ncbi:MAG: DUF1840 domain-containing protein [Comamonadaceae bacterium]|nr:DUF1840 domain-containing protein [Comamonadaceae bacterium]
MKDTVIYKFKSKVTGDLIMLEPDAKRLLRIMDKTDQAKGILLAAQISDAMAAIEKAIALEETEGIQDPKQVSLRQRSMPMLKMLKQCHDQSEDVVWGV